MVDRVVADNENPKFTPYDYLDDESIKYAINHTKDGEKKFNILSHQSNLARKTAYFLLSQEKDVKPISDFLVEKEEPLFEFVMMRKLTKLEKRFICSVAQSMLYNLLLKARKNKK